MSSHKLEERPDQWLITALISTDKDESDAVRDYLLKRYKPEIQSYLRKRVPPDYVEQAFQETWASFYKYVQKQPEVSNIGGLLQRIAQRRRADIFRMIHKEHQIESNLPWVAQTDGAVDEEVATKELLAYLTELPYGDSFLAPCERLILALEVQYKLPRAVIGRLLNKSDDTLNTTWSTATNKIGRHIREHDYRPAMWRDNPFVLRPQHRAEDATVVEQFRDTFIPNLAPDEIEPLGIRLKELKKNYAATLLVPRWMNVDTRQSEYGKLSLLLVEREAMKKWTAQARKLIRNPKRTDVFFPEACMVELNVDNGFIDLSVQTLVDVFPDVDPPDFSDQTVLSIHKPFGMLPVTFGFWDPELYLDPEVNGGKTAYDRWPFLREDSGWVDLRGSTR